MGFLDKRPMRGDVFVSDPDVAAYRESLHAEGVTDDDIRWWWNMPDGQHQELMAQDNQARAAVYFQYRAEDISKENAAAQVRRSFPIFGFPDSDKHQGDDRPLPFELKERVNAYAINQHNTDFGESMKEEVEKFSTFNAFVRAKVRAGEL